MDDMTTISNSVDINVPAIRVWNALSNPGLTHSTLKGDQVSDVGATRQCDLMGGGHVVERVVEWKEGESYTIEVIESPLPIKRARTTFRVVPIEANRSRVTMIMQYVPKFGVIGALMDTLRMRPAATAQVKGILNGLSTYVTSKT